VVCLWGGLVFIPFSIGRGEDSISFSLLGGGIPRSDYQPVSLRSLDPHHSPLFKTSPAEGPAESSPAIRRLLSYSPHARLLPLVPDIKDHASVCPAAGGFSETPAVSPQIAEYGSLALPPYRVSSSSFQCPVG